MYLKYVWNNKVFDPMSDYVTHVFSVFRMQWRIVNSVLNEKRDNCVVMATGMYLQSY